MYSFCSFFPMINPSLLWESLIDYCRWRFFVDFCIARLDEQRWGQSYRSYRASPVNWWWFLGSFFFWNSRLSWHGNCPRSTWSSVEKSYLLHLGFERNSPIMFNHSPIISNNYPIIIPELSHTCWKKTSDPSSLSRLRLAHLHLCLRRRLCLWCPVSGQKGGSSAICHAWGAAVVF